MAGTELTAQLSEHVCMEEEGLACLVISKNVEEARKYHSLVVSDQTLLLGPETTI